ncbi:MAG: DUF4479 family protein [Bacteriovoracaceae bacterium]|nr:DUF4479 family protein [Bacteriovoracaceae bacterium]
MARLSFKIFPVKDVSIHDRKIMFTIFQQYYDLPEPESFFQDFENKDDVIILYDKKTGEIKGFSTQKILEHQVEGKTHIGVFSGDTIIDRQYWGDYTLGWAFFWYLGRLCLPWPWKKVYWHLISKGYKTYLLMTNNFKTFYPRFDCPTPAFFQSLSDDFAKQLYPTTYNKERGLLIFEGPHEHLKGNVAPITEDLKSKIPHVKYFASRNPNWEQGDELVCVAEYHLFLPIMLAKKVIFKSIKRVLLPKFKSVR